MTLRRLLRGRSLRPILDLQCVIPDAVSKGIGITLWVLRGGDTNKQFNANHTTVAYVWIDHTLEDRRYTRDDPFVRL